MKLLLGSGGFSTDERKTKWRKALDDFLGPVERILFVPYAKANYDGYLERLARRGD